MTRRIGAAALAFAFLAVTAAGAQMRIERNGGQQPQVEGRIRESPPHSPGDRTETAPADARSRTTLRFEPGTHDIRRFPFPWQMGFGWAPHGYVPRWSAKGVTQVDGLASVTPPQGALSGGVQLDIDPRGAEVYVDGSYLGIVSDFSGYYKHLELPAGPHLIMIVARNYEPLIIPVVVVPGHTLPFRGSLTRAYGR